MLAFLQCMFACMYVFEAPSCMFAFITGIHLSSACLYVYVNTETDYIQYCNIL